MGGGGELDHELVHFSLQDVAEEGGGKEEGGGGENDEILHFSLQDVAEEGTGEETGWLVEE